LNFFLKSTVVPSLFVLLPLDARGRLLVVITVSTSRLHMFGDSASLRHDLFAFFRHVHLALSLPSRDDLQTSTPETPRTRMLWDLVIFTPRLALQATVMGSSLECTKSPTADPSFLFALGAFEFKIAGFSHGYSMRYLQIVKRHALPALKHRSLNGM
jgi:hypothetical protein